MRLQWSNCHKEPLVREASAGRLGTCWGTTCHNFPMSPLQAPPVVSGPGTHVSKIFSACMHAKSLQSCLTLCNPLDCNPWNSPGKNTGVGCRFLLQRIFLTQGWKLCLCASCIEGESLPLSHLGIPQAAHSLMRERGREGERPASV